MPLRLRALLTILLVVFCGENQGHVDHDVGTQNHRYHKMSPPRFATWQEKAERASVQAPTKPPKDSANAGEIRGLYFVVELDESPPPKGGHSRRRRDTTVVSDGSPGATGGQGGGVAPTITTLAVESSISNRFSTTDIKSVLTNPGGVDKEGRFVVQIPEKAFISNFTMLIGGKLFIGEVKEKELAEKEYEAAKKRKETAGKVSSTTSVQPAKGMEVFSVALNVAASSSVEFVLTYQQLHERKLGVYTQTISVRPDQIVKDLTINVNIYDSQGIKFLNVSINGSEPTGQALIEKVSDQNKKITYIPDKETQMMMDPVKGLNGDLKIMYDVVHSPRDAGMVCVDGEYFIHYFSPTGFDPLNKNVAFVIDISGSMSGTKIEQTLVAMKAILDILRPGDMFKLILFHTTLVHWPERQGLIPATPDNIYSAKKFLEGELKALGSTNINDALIEACRTLKSNTNNQLGSNIIVFLTDGQPTAGETSPEKIVANVVKEAAGKVSVFSLGFGNKYELDFNLLKKISYRTGVTEGAIRIYPGLEANEQLKQFFALVNTPLMYNIRMEYPLDIVIIDTVTQNEFPQYFEGSELVVAGKLNPNNVNKQMSVVVGGTTRMEVKFRKEVDLSDSCPVVSRGYAQRLYAYMKVKYLLIQAEKTDSKSVIQQIKKDALQLALDYNLVTPLTSMLIVQRVPEAGNFYGEEDSSVPLGAFSSKNNAVSVAVLSKATALSRALLLILISAALTTLL